MSDDSNTATPNTVENDVEAERSVERPSSEAEPTDADDERRAEILRQLAGQFAVKGKVYHFKQHGEPVAFVDKGSKLVSASTDERAATAMAAMAEGRGWSSIKVSGHPKFRQAVWLEASARGLAVRGYTATVDDRAALEARLARQTQNTVEQIEKPPERAQATQSTRAVEPSAEPKDATNDKLRSYTGFLIDHGAAPYKHDPNAKPSYYAIIEVDGELDRTIWGKDLERAFDESDVELGGRLTLVNTGSEPVTVDGKQAHLNRWEATRTNRARVISAVSSKVFDKYTDDPEMKRVLETAMRTELARRDREGTTPAVPVYDKQAPAPTVEPQREHDAGKSIERAR